MVRLKYFWCLAKGNWRNAVDASAALYVSFSVILYLVTGRISDAATALANLMPIITATLFVPVLLFQVFFMSQKEAKNWMPLKQWVWNVFFLVGLVFSFYFIALTGMIRVLPLSGWMCREEVGWTVFIILFVLAIVIVLTGKEIKNQQVL